MPWKKLRAVSERIRLELRKLCRKAEFNSTDCHEAERLCLERLYYGIGYYVCFSPNVFIYLGIVHPPRTCLMPKARPYLKFTNYNYKVLHKEKDRIAKLVNPEIDEIQKIILDRFDNEILPTLPLGTLIFDSCSDCLAYYTCRNCKQFVNSEYDIIPRFNYCEWCGTAIKRIVAADGYYEKSIGLDPMEIKGTK